MIRRHAPSSHSWITATTALTAFDRTSKGILLIDSASEVMFLNRAAQHILGKHDGLKLKKHANQTGLGQLREKCAIATRFIGCASFNPGLPFIECGAFLWFSAYSWLIRANNVRRGIFSVGNQNEFRDSSKYASIILLTDHSRSRFAEKYLVRPE